MLSPAELGFLAMRASVARATLLRLVGDGGGDGDGDGGSDEGEGGDDEAADRRRRAARELGREFDALLRSLAGDPTEDEREGAGGGGGAPPDGADGGDRAAGELLVHDTNSATIRFSLIKRLRTTSLAPIASSWLIPALDELLTTAWVRCRCLYFPLGGGANSVSDSELQAAAGAVFDMKKEALEKDYYGTKRRLCIAVCAELKTWSVAAPMLSDVSAVRHLPDCPAFLRQRPVLGRLRDLDEGCRRKVSRPELLSPYNFAAFYAAALLPPSTARAIYLDPDVVVASDLIELMQLPLGEQPLAAVEDCTQNRLGSYVSKEL